MASSSAQKSFQQINEILLDQYGRAKVLEADKTLRELEREIFRLPVDGIPEDAELKELRLEYLRAKVWYDTIKVEAEEVRSLLKGFETEAGDWAEKMEDSHGTRVMWKPTKGSPIHTIRLDGKLPHSMFNILAVIMEVDMYLSWIPTIMGIGLKRIDMLADLDRFRKLVHADASIPWPLANRDCNLIGYGVDLIDQGRVLAVARSYDCAPDVPHNIQWALFPETAHLAAEESDISQNVTNAPSLYSAPPSNPAVAAIVEKLQKIPSQIPKASSKIVRAKVHEGGFLLTPLSDTETEVSILFQVDPELAIMPSWLINWCMKHFSFTALELLGKAASQVGTPTSPYTSRMAQKPEVYEYLRQRLEDSKTCSPQTQEERKAESLSLLNVPIPLHSPTLNIASSSIPAVSGDTESAESESSAT